MNTQDQAEIVQASSQEETRTVTLETPIKRGESAFSSVTIRRPYGPALRGVSLAKILTLGDHDAFATLIPRITHPTIFKSDIESGALDLGDMINIVEEIGIFFLPKSAREKTNTSQTE